MREITGMIMVEGSSNLQTSSRKNNAEMGTRHGCNSAQNQNGI